MIISAPLYVLGLFFACFAISAFLRLAIGKPIAPKKNKPTKRRNKQDRKIYFLTDLKSVESNPEPRKALMEGRVYKDDLK